MKLQVYIRDLNGEQWLVNFFKKSIRIPEFGSLMRQYQTTIMPQIANIRESLPRDVVLQTLKEFITIIENAKISLEQLATPAIVYEKCGIIHFVNSAYKSYSGFNLTLPTEMKEFQYYHQFSEASYVKIFLFYFWIIAKWN